MRDLAERVQQDNTVAATSRSHVPRYTEDDVEVIEQVYRNGAVEEVDVVEVLNSAEAENEGGGRTTVVTGNESGGRTATASTIVVPPAFTGRKIPFPNVGTDGGKSNGYQIMRVAKRVGWEVSIKSGNKIRWLERQIEGWFSATGMFRRYKAVNAQRLSKFVTDLLRYAKTAFPLNQHSTDPTGAEDEEIPSYVLLCREFEEWKKSSPSANTQQQANRIVNAVVQQSLMEPRNPLGATAAPLRSQVRTENAAANSNRTNASTVLHEGAGIVGIVEDAGVESNVAALVSNGVTAAIEGISGGRRTRRDVISHIERTRDRQATRLVESLGMLLNNIVHPPRTIVEISRDYREAQRSFQDATSDEQESFWRSVCSKLASELDTLGN